MRKNPHAVALGRKGGRANTPAQVAARLRNVQKGTRPPSYRLTADRGLERRTAGQWTRLEPPYDALARLWLRRQQG